MKLGRYLEVTGVTQGAFAKTIGVRQSTVHYWATGEHVPTPATIKKIIKITSGAVRAEDFLPDEQEVAA